MAAHLPVAVVIVAAAIVLPVAALAPFAAPAEQDFGHEPALMRPAVGCLAIPAPTQRCRHDGAAPLQQALTLFGAGTAVARFDQLATMIVDGNQIGPFEPVGEIGVAHEVGRRRLTVVIILDHAAARGFDQQGFAVAADPRPGFDPVEREGEVRRCRADDAGEFVRLVDPVIVGCAFRPGCDGLLPNRDWPIVGWRHGAKIRSVVGRRRGQRRPRKGGRGHGERVGGGVWWPVDRFGWRHHAPTQRQHGHCCHDLCRRPHRPDVLQTAIPALSAGPRRYCVRNDMARR